MDKRRYCVYNQTSECFLSLGVTREDRGFARFKGLLRGRAPRYDEGHWLSRPTGVHLFCFFSSRDLVFLDAKHRVLQAIESFPPFRFVSIGENVASVVELPVHTIDSSQTRPGNQIVICVAEEMEFRLRSMPDLDKDDLIEPFTETKNVPVQKLPPSRHDRRTIRRNRWPGLVAYNSSGGVLEVHGVRDLSADGLYLMTEARWPLGTMITLTLQRTDGVSDDILPSAITVQLSVIHWGKDGVRLAFTQSAMEESPLVVLAAR